MEDMRGLFAQHGALTVNGQGSMVAGVSDVFYGTIGGQEGQDGRLNLDRKLNYNSKISL